MADEGYGLTNLLAAIQNGVGAANNLTQIVTQATVNSSSLRVQIAGLSTTVGTVTLVNTGSGLTGGPFTAIGTISLLSSVGTVQSVGSGVGLTGGPITTTGSLAVSLTTLANSLSSDVALTNTSSYFDGPSVAQGSSGVWFASGTVTFTDTATARIRAKLWDGTTIADSAESRVDTAAGNFCMSLSGILTNPSSNIKISVQDNSNTTGKILANATGSAKDSTITVMRIG